MFRLNIFVLFVLFVLFSSCSKEQLKESTIKGKSLDLQVIEAYQGGLEALDAGDVLFAAKKFNEAEILFPQGEWAPKSALMAAYSYYTQDYYGDAIAELERFLKVYPLHKNLEYVYYLLGICYYEQIVDEKKDLQSIIKAKKNFQIVVKNYPNTEYALDSEFKINFLSYQPTLSIIFCADGANSAILTIDNLSSVNFPQLINSSDGGTLGLTGYSKLISP